MLLMASAHARKSGDGRSITTYYDLLRKWADFLVKNSLQVWIVCHCRLLWLSCMKILYVNLSFGTWSESLDLLLGRHRSHGVVVGVRRWTHWHQRLPFDGGYGIRGVFVEILFFVGIEPRIISLVAVPLPGMMKRLSTLYTVEAWCYWIQLSATAWAHFPRMNRIQCMFRKLKRLSTCYTVEALSTRRNDATGSSYPPQPVRHLGAIYKGSRECTGLQKSSSIPLAQSSILPLSQSSYLNHVVDMYM